MKKIIKNGYNYVVWHQYSENQYSFRAHYIVLTNNPKWCGSLIPELCGYPDVMSKGEHDILYKREPTMHNAFKPYYKVDFVEDDWVKHLGLPKNFPVDTDSYYSFEYVEPSMD